MARLLRVTGFLFYHTSTGCRLSDADGVCINPYHYAPRHDSYSELLLSAKPPQEWDLPRPPSDVRGDASMAFAQMGAGPVRRKRAMSDSYEASSVASVSPPRVIPGFDQGQDGVTEKDGSKRAKASSEPIQLVGEGL